MMRDFTLGQYFPGNSVIHRLDPRTKLLGTVALIVAVLSAAAYGVLDRGTSVDFTAFERTYLMIGMGAVCFTPIALIRVRFRPAAFFAPLIVTVPSSRLLP